MTVTSVVELDKKRCKIYLDGEFSFVLYKGELRDYNIMAGQEISDANYQEIIDVILPKRCKLRAMNLLQKKDYTEKQLRDKLSEGLGKGISKDIFMPIVEELYVEEDSDVELDQIRKLLAKKHYDQEETDFKDKQKIMAFLLRKGFQMSDIRRAMDIFE